MSPPTLVLPITPLEAAQGPVVHDIAVQVVLSCPCSPRRALVIRHVTDATICPACQRHYVVLRAQFDPQQQPALTVALGMRDPAIVRPSPPGAVS